MKKWAFLTVLLMTIGIFSVCTKLQDQPSKVTTLGIAPYVPPMPTLPNTVAHSLGRVIVDAGQWEVDHFQPATPYTVKAQADDGKLLYSLFPPGDIQEVSSHWLNVDTVWLWGDGASSAHTPYATHTYARAGNYTVICQMAISFRGGSIARINCEAPISIAEPSSVPVIDISTNSIGPFNGYPEKADEVVTFTARNTGGRDVLVTPSVKTSGASTIQDVSWITIAPKEFIVPHDSIPVPFTIRLKWSRCPVVTATENFKMKIGFTLDLLTDGWYLPYTSATVVPGG